MTIGRSSTRIGRATNDQHAIRFGAKVFSEQQKEYAKVKRELRGIVTMMKVDQGYLIDIEVVIETNFLQILGSRCAP